MSVVRHEQVLDQLGADVMKRAEKKSRHQHVTASSRMLKGCGDRGAPPLSEIEPCEDYKRGCRRDGRDLFNHNARRLIELRLVVDTTNRNSIKCVNLRNSLEESDLRRSASSALVATAA